MKTRTRYAPSPTGIPHIGNTRTALFAYLLAKKNNGKFILRIEDTDQTRTVPGALDAIYEIHQFLGLTPDEGPQSGGKYGPYIQTERLDLYRQYAQKLIHQGVAYEDGGAIRIQMPAAGYSSWHDLVQGIIKIPNKEVDNKVLLKSNGVPTYHLAAMVDDHLMKVSHIIRGVEYIVSTPVHLQIFEALKWEPPKFMHVPLLLGPDKTKLSKRHKAKSVLEYKDEGYLPQAINNFLFYLGFSYKDNSDLLTLKEMAQVFDETKLKKSNAIFDQQKLDWFNSQWIKKLSPPELLPYLQPFLTHHVNEDTLLTIIPLVQTRITTLKEFPNLTNFFFKRPDPDPELKGKKEFLQAALSVLKSVPWNKTDIEAELVKQVETKNFNKSEFFMALRLAVCGARVTPPLTESMLILGQAEVYERVRLASLL